MAILDKRGLSTSIFDHCFQLVFLQWNALKPFEQVALVQSLMIKSAMYLEELQSELHDLTDTWVHVSTICRTVQRLGLTRKKVQLVALY